MAKTNESDAPAADTTTETATAPASTPAAARAPRIGLRVAGIAAGTVVAAGLLFGSGVAVGHALPGGHPGPDFAAGQLPFAGDRDGDHDGPRGGMPGGGMPGGDQGQRPPAGDDRPPLDPNGGQPGAPGDDTTNN